MTREHAKELLPLITAFAEGKTIQQEVRGLYQDLPEPSFSLTPSKYRIKPEPKRVPLGPDDVPLGSAIRRPHVNVAWCVVLSVSNNGVLIASYAGTTHLEFKDLMEHEWAIKCPGQDWQPCWKEESA